MQGQGYRSGSEFAIKLIEFHVIGTTAGGVVRRDCASTTVGSEEIIGSDKGTGILDHGGQALGKHRN